MEQTPMPHSHSEQADHNNAGHKPTYDHGRVELT